jgi:ParB family chromosome partitioning protein
MTYAGIKNEHADLFNAHTSKPLIIRALLGRCKQACQGGKKLVPDPFILDNKDKNMPHESATVMQINADRFDMGSPSLFWPRTFDDRLLYSLKKNGQFVPVLATFDGDRPCLLAGQRRVKALGELGLPVLTLIRKDDSPLQRGIVFLESNSNQHLDDGAMISALRYFSTCTENLSPIARLLGVSLHSRQWNLLADWLNLPESWDNLLLNGHVPLVLAKMLTRFTLEDLRVLQEYFMDMSWSRNNAVHFVTWIWEVSRVKECSPATLMNELDFKAICALDLSPKDSMTRILDTLRAARYPRLCRQEREFRKRSQDVVAGSGWRLVQPDQFETCGVEFTARVSSPQEFDERVHELADIARDRVWGGLDSLQEGK